MPNTFMPFAPELMQSLQTAWAQAAQQWGQAATMPFFKSQPDKQADDTKALTTPVFQDLFSVMGAAGQALCGGLGALHIDPTRLQELQQRYLQEMRVLWQDQGQTAEIAQDRRFAGESWKEQPLSGLAAAMHLVNSRFMLSLAKSLE
ncbi:MAG: hypothetical protein KBG95_07460, partial [Brachymonas sp.]|nr:hypothetical protein [Brachymonas sp.]